MIRFEIPYPPKKAEWGNKYSMNALYAGKHWARRKQDAAYWHTLVHHELARQKVAKRILQKPVVITFFWNDRMDIDNHAYMAKMIVDGLKGYLLTDDSRKYLRGVVHRFHDRDCVLVQVEEIG